MRTKNTIYNFISDIIYSLLIVIINFISRKLIINYFSIQLIGLTDILNQIINILSLSEMGISSVIMYNLYKPIKEKNQKKICQIMSLFKNYYHYVSIIILTLGIIFIPFLKFLINNYSININYTIVYILFLFQSSLSYLFSYKIILIKADQKSYLYIYLNTSLKFITFIIEIIILYITKNYILYLFIIVINSVLINYIISKYISNKYKFLKHKYNNLSNNETKNIKKNINNSFFSLLSGKVTESSDFIIISLFDNVSTLGLYCNYYLILSTLYKFVNKLFLSMQASLGEKFLDDKIDSKYKMYNNLSFLSFILATFASLGYYLLINDAINIWLGNKYILNDIIKILLSIQLFIFIYRIPLWNYMMACGLFKEDKITAFIGCISNIILSILLYLYIGISGVIIGTILSQSIQLILKITLAFIHSHINNKQIIFDNISKLFLFILMFFISYIISLFINNILSCIIIYIMFIISIYTLYRNSDEFIYFYGKLRYLDVFNFKKNL